MTPIRIILLVFLFNCLAINSNAQEMFEQGVRIDLSNLKYDASIAYNPTTDADELSILINQDSEEVLGQIFISRKKTSETLDIKNMDLQLGKWKSKGTTNIADIEMKYYRLKKGSNKGQLYIAESGEELLIIKFTHTNALSKEEEAFFRKRILEIKPLMYATSN